MEENQVNIFGEEVSFIFLSELIWRVVTIFLTFLKNRNVASNKFFDTLDIKLKIYFPITINIFPSWSIVFIHEKLNDKEAAGINNIVKKINAPIFPIIEDKETKTWRPKMPPKLFWK